MKLDVKKTMDFLRSKGVKLPMGYLLLHEPERITEEDLDVKGNLDLMNTDITSLPEGLKVEGYLDLYNTKITSLPNRLKVEGYLDLKHTPVKILPEDLEVGGVIFVGPSKLGYFRIKYPKFKFRSY